MSRVLTQKEHAMVRRQVQKCIERDSPIGEISVLLVRKKRAKPTCMAMPLHNFLPVFSQQTGDRKMDEYKQEIIEALRRPRTDVGPGEIGVRVTISDPDGTFRVLGLKAGKRSNPIDILRPLPAEARERDEEVTEGPNGEMYLSMHGMARVLLKVVDTEKRGSEPWTNSLVPLLYVLKLNSEQALIDLRKSVGDEAVISVAGDCIRDIAKANRGEFYVPKATLEGPHIGGELGLVTVRWREST